MDFKRTIAQPHESVLAHIGSFYFWLRCSHIRSRQSGNACAHDDAGRVRKQNPGRSTARCPILRPPRSDLHAVDGRL
jgi:hypothetical protein